MENNIIKFPRTNAKSNHSNFMQGRAIGATFNSMRVSFARALFCGLVSKLEPETFIEMYEVVEIEKLYRDRHNGETYIP